MPEYKVTISKRDGSQLSRGIDVYECSMIVASEEDAVISAYSSFGNNHNEKSHELIHKVSKLSN